MKKPILGDGILCVWQKANYKQLLRIMKLTSILLFFIGLHVSANDRSQGVSFIGKSVSEKKVFAGIEKQTGFVILFEKSLMNEAKPLTLNVWDVVVDEALKVELKGQRLNYYVGSKTIFIGKEYTGWLSGGNLDKGQVIAYGKTRQRLRRGKSIHDRNDIVSKWGRNCMTNGNGPLNVIDKVPYGRYYLSCRDEYGPDRQNL